MRDYCTSKWVGLYRINWLQIPLGYVSSESQSVQHLSIERVPNFSHMDYILLFGHKIALLMQCIESLTAITQAAFISWRPMRLIWKKKTVFMSQIAFWISLFRLYNSISISICMYSYFSKNLLSLHNGNGRSRVRYPMRWFLNKPNPSGRTRPWGLLGL
jgi:hypothetical protein